MSELSGRELDRAVCVALGWQPVGDRFIVPWDWQADEAPTFSSSLDACFGPGGITDWLEQRDFTLSLLVMSGKVECNMTLWSGDGESVIKEGFEEAQSLPVALCRAFLKVIG